MQNKQSGLSPLILTKDFFDALTESGVQFCHWKSNQHLSEALTGKTDLDILIDQKFQKSCEIILLNLKFKKICGMPISELEGIENWLGFDYATGRLIHLHLHYSLIMGEKRLKNLNLPLQAWLLDDCTIEKGTPIPQPEKELILLIIRIIIKSNYKTFLRAFHPKPAFLFPDNIWAELDWLLSRTENSKLLSTLENCPIRINPDFVFYFVDKFKSKSLSGFNLLKLKYSVSLELKAYKRFQGLTFWSKLFSSHIRINNLSKAFLKTRRKRPSNGGTFFALVGADGAGKTTLCRDLVKWLQWKLDVSHIYFGIPKESFSYRIKKRPAIILNSLAKRFYRFKLIKLGDFTKQINQILESLLWLSLANLRKKNFVKSVRNSQQGIITIAERYPLKDLWSMETPMDGPRIKSERLVKKIRTKERESYGKIELPDRVFILKVKINELRKRKNDLGFASHKQKEDAINNLPKRTAYRFINASENYDQVLLQLKRLLWEDL